MKNKKNMNLLVLGAIYIYLCIPVVIFMLGWCRWYIGITASVLLAYCVVKCIREHRGLNSFEFIFGKHDILKILLALAFIMSWVWLSGIGKFVWQNSDHSCRNAMYELLVTHSWPVRGSYEVEGVMQSRAMVYYLGFWLPAALIGKIFGMQAGYVAQYIWAVIGIFLLYFLLCIWRKRVLVWPLLLMIMFSGLDIIGAFVHFNTAFHILGTEHLERWPDLYQFSGMTTQLFWVFNQAIPAWIASSVIFIEEKPRNIVFVCSLIMLTSTFPFVGLLPYAIYYMITRSEWKSNETVREVLENIVQNIFSIQNVLGGCTGIISFLYLVGNISGEQTNLFASNMIQKRWMSWTVTICAIIFLVAIIRLMIVLYLKGHRKTLIIMTSIIAMIACGFIVNKYFSRIVGMEAQFRRLVLLIVFYFLEVGIYLIYMYKKIKYKGLFWLNTIWLFMIPNITIGTSIDFCMRASIPGLFLIMMWCIETLDENRGKVYSLILIALLAIGSVTSLHEIGRTIVNTVRHEQIINVTEEEIMTAGNFSGNTENIFWKYIAKD